MANDGYDFLDRTTRHISGDALHNQARDTATKQKGMMSHTVFVQGMDEQVSALYQSLECGSGEGLTQDPFTARTNAPAVVQSAVYTRGEGNISTCAITVSNVDSGYCANLSFETRSESIFGWRQGEASSKPALDKVMAWFGQRDSSDVEARQRYAAKKYVDPVSPSKVKSLGDDTPEGVLAGMVLKGIETYTTYVPSLCVTNTFPSVSDVSGGDYSLGARVGKVVEASDITLNERGANLPYGESTGAAYDAVSAFVGIVQSRGMLILCTGEQGVQNGDGTYTITANFTAVKSVCAELYSKQDGGKADDAKFGPGKQG